MTDTTIVNHVAFNLSAGAKMPELVGQIIEDVLFKKDEVKIGPVTLLDKMDKAGVDFSAFPIIGSRGGNNPHYYPLPEGKADDEGDAYIDRFKGTEKGKLAQQQLDDIKVFFHKDTLGKTTFFPGKSETWMKDEKARLQAHIKAGGALLQKALACQQQEVNFRSNVDPKKVFFNRNWENPNEEDEDKLVMKRTRTPYIMADAKQPTSAMRLTIEQFISIDVATANMPANGGTYAALKATMSKGAGDVGAAIVQIKKAADLYAIGDVVADYLRVDTAEGKKRVERFKLSLQDKDHGKTNILAFGDFVMSLDHIFEEIAPDYRKYSAQRLRETSSLAKDENKNVVTKTA